MNPTIAQLDEVSKQLLRDSTKLLMESADLFDNYLPNGEEKCKVLKTTIDQMKKCLQIDYSIKECQKHVLKILAAIDDASEDELDEMDIDSVINESEDQKLKITREALESNPNYSRLKDILSKYDEDEKVDEEIITTQQTINLIDPITKCKMTDPVRHKPCGHVYDRASILSMIEARGKKGFRCPNMGCVYRNKIDVNDLEEAHDYVLEINKQRRDNTY